MACNFRGILMQIFTNLAISGNAPTGIAAAHFLPHPRSLWNQRRRLFGFSPRAGSARGREQVHGCQVWLWVGEHWVHDLTLHVLLYDRFEALHFCMATLQEHIFSVRSYVAWILHELPFLWGSVFGGSNSCIYGNHMLLGFTHCISWPFHAFYIVIDIGSILCRSSAILKINLLKQMLRILSWPLRTQ